MEEILRKLVSFQSVTGEHTVCNQTLDYVERYLEDRGLYTRRFESNGFGSLIATVKSKHKTPKVLLTGHIDVVPADKNQFDLVKKDGRYYGRGVLDMKFAIASYMWLVDQLQDELEKYDFGIMVTSDEEVDGTNGAKMLIDQGYEPEVAVVPDGGEDWAIEEFAKGIQWIKLTASGRPGHASRPWEGESAIAKLLNCLHVIEQVFPEEPGKQGTFFSVGTISGGKAPNQIAEHATATLDVRYGTLADYEDVYPKIRKLCHQYDVDAELVVDDPPVVHDPTNPYVKAFRTIMLEKLGYDPGSSFAFATTDGRHFAAAGIPCIIVEPEGAGRHSKAEWISVEGCDMFYDILKRYLSEVATKPQPKKVTKKAT